MEGTKEKQKSIIVVYDCINEKFTYPADMKELFGTEFDERALWEILQNIR